MRMGHGLRFLRQDRHVAHSGMWPTVGRNRATLSAQVTHDHPEGVKGAAAVADAIFMCRYHFGGWHGEYERPISDQPEQCKEHIWKHIQREYSYDLSRTLDEIRPGYQFNETCQETVPQAIIAFLESRDFEDAIRNAIPWAATATPWPPSQEASPRRHTESPIGLRKRPSPIWTFPCWM